MMLNSFDRLDDTKYDMTAYAKSSQQLRSKKKKKRAVENARLGLGFGLGFGGKHVQSFCIGYQVLFPRSYRLITTVIRQKAIQSPRHGHSEISFVALTLESVVTPHKPPHSACPHTQA